MKTFRLILIILAAPAAILYALKEIGGSPLYKGDDVGFVWRVTANPTKLVLTNDVGDIACLLRLKLPINSTGYKAQLANQSALRVSSIKNNGEDGWIELSADSQMTEEKFRWPSGIGIFVFTDPGAPADLRVKDWEIYLTDKHPDSQQRSGWRKIGLVVSIVCLIIALIGGALEVADKTKPVEKGPFTPEKLVEILIDNVEGTSSDSSKWMRSILKKSVLQGIPLSDALASIPVSEVEKKGLFIAASRQLKKQLELFLTELTRYSSRHTTSISSSARPYRTR